MKKNLLLLLILTISLSSVAQTVTIYDAYNTDRSINKSDIKPSINNYVQWNLSMLARGAFLLTYERRINDYFGVEVGAGPTLLDPFFYVKHDIFDDPFGSDEGTKLKVGYMLSVTPKLYPKKMVDFEGFYVAPSIRYRRYNYEQSISYDHHYNTIPTQTFSQSLKAVDYAFIVGYQYELWSEITWNTYIGMAWSNRTFDTIDKEKMRPVQEKDSGPLFLLGWSLGFTF